MNFFLWSEQQALSVTNNCKCGGVPFFCISIDKTPLKPKGIFLACLCGEESEKYSKISDTVENWNKINKPGVKKRKIYKVLS